MSKLKINWWNTTDPREIEVLRGNWRQICEEQTYDYSNLLSRFYCNKRLKEIYHEKLQKQQPNILHKFLLLLREYEDKEQKQVK